MRKIRFSHVRNILIPLGITLAVVNVARADTYNPIILTPGSYNADVVVEKTAPPPIVPGAYTTASMDQGTNNGADTWMEQGFFTNTAPVPGLPPAGSVISTNVAGTNYSFLLAPSYKTLNSIMLDNTGFSNKYTLTLGAPASLSGISFLTSGGNGGCIFRWTTHHQDSSAETGTLPSADWFFVDNPVFIANGRANAQNFSLDNYNSANPRLYAKNINLANTGSPVTSIDLQYVSSAGGAHTCIMAVAGRGVGGTDFTTTLPVTGYNADIVVEASAGQPLPVVGFTTASMDGGTNNNGSTWYEQGWNTNQPLTGLPAAGSTFTSTNIPGHNYTMAPSYAGNNAIYADSNSPVATLTFATPASYNALSFLSANANGAITVQVLVNHQDGTTETNQFVSKDWFGGVPAAWTANGRVNLDNRILNAINSANPRIYEALFLLTNTSPVTSCNVSWTTNGNPSATSRFVILAVSGNSGPVSPIITASPASFRGYEGSNVTFTASIAGTPPFGYQWQIGTNGTWVNLANGGNISGVTSATLAINNDVVTNQGDYRVIVSNAAGSTPSSPATLTVFSLLADMAQPSDSITLLNQPYSGSTPDGEKVVHLIDSDTSKYLNFGNGQTPFNTTVGAIWSPQSGSVIIKGLRFFTANDAPERDPANSILEGSNDGGAHWNLIVSNSFTLPDGRNASPAPLDPLAQNCLEIDFSNTNAYASYRWSVSQIKGTANLMQIGELQFLGVVNDSPIPFFTVQPQPQNAYEYGVVTLNGFAVGNPAPDYYWLKGTNGVYVKLSDGGNVSGSQGTFLTLNPVTFADIADYVLVATNSAGFAYSAPATVNVLDTNLDITSPLDNIVSFGDESLGFWGVSSNAANAIDNGTSKYQNGGSGFSAAAGFPPFQGPVGVVITPVAGPSLVKGLRFYTADGNPERDPQVYQLEGSNNGTAWTTIASGPVALPAGRNAGGKNLDPLTQYLQEFHFANSSFYSSYRLTLNILTGTDLANSLQIGELELLGIAQLKLDFVLNADGSIVITPLNPPPGYFDTGSPVGTLQSTTALQGTNTVWTDEGTLPAGGIILNPSPLAKAKFYRVKSQ